MRAPSTNLNSHILKITRSNALFMDSSRRPDELVLMTNNTGDYIQNAGLF